MSSVVSSAWNSLLRMQVSNILVVKECLKGIFQMVLYILPSSQPNSIELGRHIYIYIGFRLISTPKKNRKDFDFKVAKSHCIDPCLCGSQLAANSSQERVLFQSPFLHHRENSKESWCPNCSLKHR